MPKMLIVIYSKHYPNTISQISNNVPLIRDCSWMLLIGLHDGEI